MAGRVHLAFWIIVGLVGFANIQGYRYVVESPVDCPSTWEGEEVFAWEMNHGAYECTIPSSSESGTVNVPVGRRRGLMPWWLALLAIVGAFVGYHKANQPYRFANEKMRAWSEGQRGH